MLGWSCSHNALCSSRRGRPWSPGELWLNADILQGPGGAPPLFDPETFISTCTAAQPEAKLSLGWTTGFLFNPRGYNYTEPMLMEVWHLSLPGRVERQAWGPANTTAHPL